MNAKECYQAGDLSGAIAAATEDVRQHPLDAARRGFLAELLCFAGELERADKQLDAIGHQDPQLLLGISMLRQLLRAEMARQQFYAEGRLPEFLGPPEPHLAICLDASIRLREGKQGEAAGLLEQADQCRPRAAGVCGGRPFDDLRDIDDLTAPFFEVLTSNGKYYWIPMERVELVEFRAPERPRDLLWRRAHMVVRGGPDGEVFLPALYPGTHAAADDRLRLGRMTDWRGGEGAPVGGVGQRMFQVGEEDVAIMELREIVFSNPVSGRDHGETAS
jgi:type VI secretion system protein ImpE